MIDGPQALYQRIRSHMQHTAAENAGAEPIAYWAPGRVEVLGKHTDYAGGDSLVMATSQGFCVAAQPRCDGAVTVTSADAPALSISFPLTPDLEPQAGDWSNYPMTVARRLARNFPTCVQGADIVFASTLPQAAGMSSSSALMIGVYLVLGRINRLEESEQYRANIDHPLMLAEYLGTIENGQSYGMLEGDRGVGTFGGSEDHTAILCSRPGHFGRFAYCPTRFVEEVAMPADYVLAIADSGVAADKTGSVRDDYNRASALARAVTEIWNRVTRCDDPHLCAVLKRCQGQVGEIRAVLSAADHPLYSVQQLSDRLQHFAVEQLEILPAAVAALRAGDLAAFGAAVDLSQRQGAALLANQIPETVALAETARAAGAVAASAFGAGFGGSVWAMVRRQDAPAFLALWQSAYQARFAARNGRFFLTEAGPPAHALEA